MKSIISLDRVPACKLRKVQADKMMLTKTDILCCQKMTFWDTGQQYLNSTTVAETSTDIFTR